jgi:alpha-mannosidase
MEKEKDIIDQCVKKLRNFSEVDILSNWTVEKDGVSTKAEIDNDGVFWEMGNKPCTIKQQIVIPTDVNGYKTQGMSLKLWLFWQANEAKIYIDGKLAQEGDLFDCNTRIDLLNTVQGEESFEVRIDFISPDMLKGLLLKSKLMFENYEGIDPSFVADELEVVSKIGMGLFHESFKSFELSIKDIFDTYKIEKHDDIEKLLLKIRRKNEIWRKPIEGRTIYMSSHSHLDLAWLWPVSETWKVAKNTFRSVLNLQSEFNELTYNHSTPALYEWIETNEPELFRDIQKKVVEKRWEVLTGFWVEPELNLIDGESIIRQALYGQLYTKEKFGKYSKVAWLPDIFGFCSQLPQIMKNAGIKYFVTQKLRWNDTTKFPYDLFNWEAPDGTSILSLMSAPIGEHVDPVKMAD